MTTRKLKLSAGAPTITGAGDRVALSLSGNRLNKAGNLERYVIQFDMGIWHILQLARQIATMHVRDRRRLEIEMRRIEVEKKAIHEPEVES